MTEKLYTKCNACDGQGSQVFDEAHPFNSVMSLPPSFCIVCDGTGFVEQDAIDKSAISPLYKGKSSLHGSFAVNIQHVAAVIPSSQFNIQKVVLVDGSWVSVDSNEAKNVIKHMELYYDQ